MELYFLGTGAGLPSKQRNVTATALQLLQERGTTWLFDCGEGTQHKVLHSPVRLSKIEKIWITHLHGDHLFGLPGILGSRSFHGGTTPLEIYGPPGLQTFLDAALTVSETHLTYDIDVKELDEGIVFEDAQFRVESGRLSHGITSFGFRVIEKDSPGELCVHRLQAEGISPGPLYGQLKQGQRVTLADGRVLFGEDYLAAPKRGRVVAIMGDTRKCARAIALASGADVLVHEATFSSARGDLAHSYNHSTSAEAAEVAMSAGVKTLILTHISARYQIEGTGQLLQEAKGIFPATMMAQDNLRYEVPRTQAT